MARNRIGGLLLVIAMLVVQARPAGADAVDDYINAEIARRHIPGLSLAVVRDGKVAKLGGYGLANVELNVTVTPDTVFQIQSVTKTFTSTAILMLVEQGKIALDDPVGKYLEGTPDSWKPIKIRHLLSHTSGIKDFINEPTASLRLDVTEEEVLKATAPRPLNFTPGDRYSYSNTNYHLLAMIIRKLTGLSYGDYLAERIFRPLGMSSTRIVSLSALIPNRAAGYQWAGGTLRNGQYVAESILGYGGGGIVSTASDMAKWAIALDGEKLLKRATFEQAWTAMKLNDGKASSYGLGWGVGSVNGHKYVSHSGAHMTGFTSSFTRYGDDHLTVIVLTNAGHANPGRIAQHVAGIYVPGLTPQPAKAIEDKDPRVTEVVREIGQRIREGKLGPEHFTPTLWLLLAPQLKDLQQQIEADGDLKSIELLDRSRSGSERTYQYRMTFSGAIHLVTVTVNSDGKISGLWAENE
ncbi:MAG TPA: serine hydrolase domain-containing protein [Tepidisphaeraceae bacterium]